jgi:hypothetical protein
MAHEENEHFPYPPMTAASGSLCADHHQQYQNPDLRERHIGKRLSKLRFSPNFDKIRYHPLMNEMF